MKAEFKTYQEFWPFYLSQHSKRATRIIHTAGTLIGITTAIVMSLEGRMLNGVIMGVVIGYGSAWFSHFTIEKNRPAAWSYFWWSFISEFRMGYLTLIGRL